MRHPRHVGFRQSLIVFILRSIARQGIARQGIARQCPEREKVPRVADHRSNCRWRCRTSAYVKRETQSHGQTGSICGLAGAGAPSRMMKANNLDYGNYSGIPPIKILNSTGPYSTSIPPKKCAGNRRPQALTTADCRLLFLNH